MKLNLKAQPRNASLYPHVTVLNLTANISQTVITKNYS